MRRNANGADQLEFPWSESPRCEPPPQPPPMVQTVAPRNEADGQDGLQAALRAHSGLRISLTITDNTSRMLSVKQIREGDVYQVRVHRMFLSADGPVQRALAQWIRSPRSRQKGTVIDEFIRDHEHHIRATPPKPESLVHQGRRFDLKALFDEVNREHFAGAVTAAITWGQMPVTGRRRSIRFGSYSPRGRLIRIHPALDRQNVPRYFVRYIVFHEMLHAALGIEETANGRRRIHTRAFKQLEQAYPDYRQALEWQDNPANLKRLLRADRVWFPFR